METQGKEPQFIKKKRGNQSTGGKKDQMTISEKKKRTTNPMRWGKNAQTVLGGKNGSTKGGKTLANFCEVSENALGGIGSFPLRKKKGQRR